MQLALGTAQFGLDYGITNSSGKINAKEASRILVSLPKYRINLIDTANAYGDSEKTLGLYLPKKFTTKIVTKTKKIRKSIITIQDVNDVELAFHNSLHQLKCANVYSLMVHDAEDLLNNGGDLLYEKLLKLRKEGLFGKIGVSVYDERQIDAVLSRFSIDCIQLPINVFDQRLYRSGHLQKLRQAGVEIHARSPFLQGIVLSEPEKLPAYFDPLKSHIVRYQKWLAELGVSRLVGTLAYLSQLGLIDYLVCGITSLIELEEICVALSAAEKLPKSDFLDFSLSDEAMINPMLWKI